VPSQGPGHDEMSQRLTTLVATIALLMVSFGCGHIGANNAAATPLAIPLTVITNNGFVGGPPIVAAPSLTDLRGLVHGIGANTSLDQCNRVPQVRAQCWLDVKDPGNSLLVGARLDEPCMTTQSVTAALSLPTEVTISVLHSGSCDSGWPPLPHLSLLAIPLNVLPTDEIAVRFVHVGIARPVAKMLVDLRRPLNLATDVEARMNEVIAAGAAATKDAVSQVPPGQSVSFVALGTNRWTDTSLACPVQGRSYVQADARGYVIFLRGSDQPQLEMEYHVSGANLAFCGRLSF
jgi:hypothetical protein